MMRPDDYPHLLLLLFLLLLLPLRQLLKEAVYTRVSLARRTHIARDCGGNHGYEKVSTCLCSGCLGRSREEESLSRARSVWKNLGKRKFTGCGGFWAISGSSEITEGTQIIGTAAARIVNAASWVVHSTTSTCLRTEHTAEHINASLI